MQKGHFAFFFYLLQDWIAEDTTNSFPAASDPSAKFPAPFPVTPVLY